MSPSIWTRCAASFRPRRLELVAWRAVESQHVVSTRKLVDSDAEQVLLEERVDGVKPPAPAGARSSAAFTTCSRRRSAGTTADLGTLTVELTAFTASVRARRGADLTRPPFREYEEAISSKTSYDAAQRLGADMRAAAIEGFLYTSARAPGRGTNVGLFVPAFASKRPRRFETWTCSADRDKVELAQKSVVRTHIARMRFARADFLVGSKLPSPAT